MSDLIKPFQLNVSEQHLSELRGRLQRVRWPDRETVNDTSQGPQLAKLQALVAHWIDGYDWRRCESMLNDFRQFKTTIDGLDIHFLHIRSPEPDAIPLLMAHGWPGSVLEFRKVIAPLSNPGAHGDDPRQAFHLVIPSMPGFGFSDKPSEPGWDMSRIGRTYVELMRRLGYERWAMQGGDLGAGVADEIASLALPELIGIHLNFAMFMPTRDEIRDATPDEERMLAGEQVRKSRRWIEQRYSDVRHFAGHEQGGHFAALENPHALVDDIRSTFASLRER